MFIDNYILRYKFTPRGLIAIATVLFLAFAANPVDARILCLRSDVVAELGKLDVSSGVELVKLLADPTSQESTKYRVHEKRDGSCFSLKDHRVCPAPGTYVIWRNRASDVWIKVSKGPDDSDIAQTLRSSLASSLSRLLPLAYPSPDVPTGSYLEARTTVVTFSGQRCLPPGFALGTEDWGDTASPLGLLDEEKSLRELAQQRGQEAESIAESVNKLRDQCASDPAACLSQLDGQTSNEFNSRRGAFLTSACAEAPNCPGGDTESTDEGDATETGDSGDGGGTGQSSVKGSGGILPAGAPPWLVDLFRMVLTYLRVDQIVENGALALFLIAPDLMNNLAEMSAALTKSVTSDDLDDAFKAARELYMLFNTTADLARNIEDAAKKSGFDSTSQMLKAVGGAIDDLPPSLRNELNSSLGKDLDRFSKYADLLASADLSDVSRIASGDPESLSSLRKKVEKKIATDINQKVKEELFEVARDRFGINEDVIAAALHGDDRSIETALAESGIERLSMALGLEPSEVRKVLTSRDIAAAQSLAAQRIVRKVSKGKLRDPGALARAIQTPSAEQVRDAIVKNVPEAKRAIDAVSQAANDPVSTARKAVERMVRERVGNALSAEALTALNEQRSFMTIVIAEIEARSGLSAEELSGKLSEEALRDKLAPQVAADEIARNAVQQLNSGTKAADVLRYLRAAYPLAIEQEVRSSISDALNVTVRSPIESLPAWVQMELLEVALSPTDENVRALRDKLLDYAVATIRKTEGGNGDVGVVIGCNSEGVPLTADETKSATAWMVQRLKPLIGLDVPIDDSLSIDEFCDRARGTIGGWLDQSLRAPPLGNGTLSVVLSLAWDEAVKSVDNPATRSFLAGIPPEKLTQISPDAIYSSFAESLSRDSDAAVALLTRAAGLEFAQPLNDALFSEPPSFNRALGVLLQVETSEPAVRDIYLALLADSVTERKKRLAHALSAFTGEPVSSADLARLPALAVDCAPQAVIRISALSQMDVCALSVLFSLLNEHLRQTGRETQLQSEEMIELLTASDQAAVTKKVLSRILCSPDVIPGSCDLGTLALQLQTDLLTRQVEFGTVLSPSQIVLVSSPLKGAIASTTESLAKRAVSTLCHTQQPPLAFDRDPTGDVQQVSRYAIEILRQCGERQPQQDLAIKSASINLARLSSAIAVADCARVRAAIRVSETEMNLEREIPECKSAKPSKEATP